MSRLVEVDPHRLDRWIEGFAERHEGVHRTDDPEGDTAHFHLLGGDNARAQAQAFDHPRIGLILIRRGGYAIGRDVSGDLVSHSCGTRYVQSRTKKGGWSQQRYARRRGNQADGVVAKVIERATGDLVPGSVDALLLGGDRALAAQVMAATGLAHLGSLPRRNLWDLPDPRLSVLEEAARRARAVRITLEDNTP